MNPRNLKRSGSSLLALAVLGLAVSCGSDSQITSSWKSTKRTKSYHDVVVVALTHDVNAKQLVENDLADALQKKNVVVNRGADIFPETFSKDTPKDEMVTKIRKTGADAILTVSLIDKETKTRYVPGSPGYTPGFWGYYSYWSPMVYSPGYYTQDRVYYIETNLYDAASDELIWSATSETYNPSSLTGFSKQLAVLLANKMQRDNVIGPFMEIPKSGRKVTSKR